MKRYLVFIFLLLTIISITSCKKKEFSYETLDSIVYENILSLNGDYLVVCYQSNCDNCENLKDTIKTYYNYTKKHSDAMPIYGININLSINKKICLLSSESYPSDMINTDDYTKVKVKSTPALLIISNHKLVKVISDYSTQRPVTDSKAYLNNLM